MFTKGHTINLGRSRNQEVKNKIRQKHLGKKISDEAKHRMSLAKKGKKPKNWDTIKQLFEKHGKTKGSFIAGISWEERYGKDKAEEMRTSVSVRFKNKKQSIGQREAKRKSQLGRNGSNWQGGKTKENYRSHRPSDLRLKVWRGAVFKRDNYVCQKCGISGVYMEADHIKEWADYPELRYIINNGQTLCKDKCHKQKTKLYLQNKA